MVGPAQQHHQLHIRITDTFIYYTSSLNEVAKSGSFLIIS